MAEQHVFLAFLHAGAGSRPAALPIKNYKAMNDKDRKLVEEAESLRRAIDWEIAYDLLREAESQQARDRIEDVVKFLYRKDHD